MYDIHEESIEGK